MSADLVRSILFVPGDSDRKIAKSAESGADAVLFDLEDSVHADAKEAAREVTARALLDGRPGQTFVRVNSLGSGLLDDDLDMLAANPPSVVMLPKCASREEIRLASDMMDARGMDPASVRLLPVATESARAVRNLMRSEWTHPRLYGLTWGAEDIAADIGALENRENGNYAGVFALARDVCLLAAREAEIFAFDTAFVDIRDMKGCAAECRRAFLAGFDGKLAIHPAQVPIINETFTPDAQQLQWARRVMAALDKAGSGVALLDGRMIDMPHRRNAEKLLRAAAAGDPTKGATT